MNLHRRLIWEPISLFLTNLVSQIVDRVGLHQLTVSRTAPGSCLVMILISKNVSYKIKNETFFYLGQVQWKDQLHVQFEMFYYQSLLFKETVCQDTVKTGQTGLKFVSTRIRKPRPQPWVLLTAQLANLARSATDTGKWTKSCAHPSCSSYRSLNTLQEGKVRLCAVGFLEVAPQAKKDLQFFQNYQRLLFEARSSLFSHNIKR